MRKGVASVVPAALLELMTWQDLEWRVCGRPYVDVGLLRRHTEYSSMPFPFPLSFPSHYSLFSSGSITGGSPHRLFMADTARIWTTRPAPIFALCVGTRATPSGRSGIPANTNSHAYQTFPFH
jgi:HECT-domain (ubiquitin-transferase)